MRRVLVPPHASTLSAFGMLVADVSRDYVQTVMLPDDTAYDQLLHQLAALEARGRRALELERVEQGNVETKFELDLRYRGQSFELRLPLSEQFLDSFHRAHEREYGYRDEATPVEIVNLRVQVIGRVEKPKLPSETFEPRPDPSTELGERPVTLGGPGNPIRSTPFFEGTLLHAGHRIAGPALISYPDTTVLLDSRDSAKVDAHRNLLQYSERVTRELLAEIPDGTYRFSQFMDDDGVTTEPAEVRVAITIEVDQAVVDFGGTCSQREGNINAVYAIIVSAVIYAFRCLLGLDVPSNSGCMAPITVSAPKGSLVNARAPAAVAAGNVETSQRIVDCLLGALAQACPGRIPAASQGTINNLTIGGWDPERERPFAYYETVAGGVGARPGKDGASAIHTHMTNTLNTPTEALEFAYPLRVRRYEIRSGSGGAGRYSGGDGVIREIELLTDAHVTILSERQRFRPYGLAGGESGRVGKNRLLHGDQVEDLPGKVSVQAQQGDRIRIETPGAGGHGSPKRR